MENNKDKVTSDQIEEQYGFLFEEELLKEIEAIGAYRKVQESDFLIDIGDPILSMPLIISGAIKILSEDKEGDELLLYFIEKGDTCAMTLSCCLQKGKSKIRAVAESDAELLMIPIEKMEEWMGRYRSWRQFILDSYHDRMQELLETVDTLAFMNMDERLFKYLKDKAMVNQNEVIQTTHQDIATDLHTSRVVISRLLKKMEHDGKIKMHRSQIQLIEL